MDYIDRVKLASLKIECDKQFTRVYIQTKCDLENFNKQRQLLCLNITFIGILMCLTFRSTIYYLRESAELNFLIWDMSMCTSGDFTIEMHIPRKIWNAWKTE